MKSSLKTLLTAAVLGLAVLPALSHAQPAAGAPGGGAGGGGRGRGQQTPEQQITALETAVGTLTADQKTKITAIYTKSADEMAKLSQEDRRGKGQEMRTALNKDIRALLNAEQQTKFDTFAAAQGNRRGGGGGQGGPGGGGARGPGGPGGGGAAGGAGAPKQ